MTPLQWKRLFFRILIIGVFIVLAVLSTALGFATWHAYTKSEEVRVANSAAHQELARLQERKVDVEQSLSELSTERGIEEVVRTRYQLAKPGESQIVLIEAENQTADTQEERGGLWGSFLEWFSPQP